MIKLKENILNVSEKKLEEKLRYEFKNKKIFRKALTHRSAVYEQKYAHKKKKRARSNERLEVNKKEILGLGMLILCLKSFWGK